MVFLYIISRRHCTRCGCIFDIAIKIAFGLTSPFVTSAFAGSLVTAHTSPIRIDLERFVAVHHYRITSNIRSRLIAYATITLQVGHGALLLTKHGIRGDVQTCDTRLVEWRNRQTL